MRFSVLFVVFALSLTGVAFVASAQTDVEIVAPPLESQAQAELGVTGYRYSRDGSVLTIEVYDGNGHRATLVVRWDGMTTHVDPRSPTAEDSC